MPKLLVKPGGILMFVDAFASKITRLRLSFAAVIAAGIICIVALVFLFFQMPIVSK